MSEDEELDPRFPGGMNYLDWLMNVLPPDEASPQNIDQIIAFQRKARMSYDSGVKPKRGDAGPKIDVIGLGLVKHKPALVRRAVKS